MFPKTEKTLFVIDAHSFLHRNYHALPKLTSSSGEEVGALYGFSKWLMKFLKEYNPKYVAVCFDSKGKNFRHKIFADYKANRKPTEAELVNQLISARDLVKKLGFKILAKEGYEADDLIAYASKKSVKEGYGAVLITSDKDVYQLTNDKDVKVWNGSAKEKPKGPEYIKEKYGVEGKYLLDYFSIVGDSSDNIPGIKGLGPKAAQDLINKFGTIENILKQAESENKDIKELMRKKLIEGKKDALMSKELFELKGEVDINDNVKDFEVHIPKKQDLADIFTKYEFKNLLHFFDAPQKDRISNQDTSVGGDLSLEFKHKGETFEKMFELAKNSNACFIQVEDNLVILATSKKEFYINEISKLTKQDKTSLLELLKNDKILKIGYDLKQTFRTIGIFCDQFINCFDINLVRYCLNSSSAFDFSGVIAKYLKQIIENESAEQNLYQYNEHVYKLKDVLSSELKKEDKEDLYYKLEQPFLSVLFDMEHNGITIDINFLREYEEKLKDEMEKIQKEIDKAAGYHININSPKQLSEFLFGKLKITPIKKTKTGYSTNEDVLLQIAHMHPIAGQILEYREAAKLRFTYVENLINLADPKTNRVHTHYDQTGTVTGRLSSAEPNLQNIPIRTEKGRGIRKAFKSSAGNTLLALDYSQIDLRILAHVSDDKTLISAFEKDEDIHIKTASEVFDTPIADVSQEQRYSAKAINFGIVYGQGPQALSRSLDIDFNKAKMYIENYFKTYSGVKNWIDNTVKMSKMKGYVKTLFGHTRYLPEFGMGVARLEAFAQRASVNTVVQGGSSDIIKKAMIDIYKEIMNTDVRMILQIHDELIFEIPEKLVDKYAGLIKDKMENAVKLKVPLRVDVKSGKNWYDMQGLLL